MFDIHRKLRPTANMPLLIAQGRGHHRIMMTKIVPFAFCIHRPVGISFGILRDD